MSNLQKLKAVKLARLEWQRWNTKADYIRVKCEYPSGGIGGEQTGKTSGGENRVEYRLCDLANAEDMAARALRDYKRKERIALELIALVEGEEKRQILILRYIDFLPAEKIGEATNFSPRNVWRLIKAALKDLEHIRTKAKGQA